MIRKQLTETVINKIKPAVGQKLFAKVHARRGVIMAEEWATVTKVGRKYFSCRFPSGNTEDFCLNRWERTGENCHHNRPILLFLTEEEARDRERALAMAGSLSKHLNYKSDWEKLSLADLEAINVIVFKQTRP